MSVSHRFFYFFLFFIHRLRSTPSDSHRLLGRCINLRGRKVNPALEFNCRRGDETEIEECRKILRVRTDFRQTIRGISYRASDSTENPGTHPSHFDSRREDSGFSCRAGSVLKLSGTSPRRSSLLLVRGTKCNPGPDGLPMADAEFGLSRAEDRGVEFCKISRV